MTLDTGWRYSLVMACAVALSYLLSRRTQRPLGLSPVQRWGVNLGAFCGAMLGAKLPMAVWHPGGALALASWLDNGKTILGGLAGGYAGVELAKAALDVKVKTGDAFVVPVAVGVAVGRIGCFVAGCCYGAPTTLPWGLDFGDGVPRHPTQLYEAVFHLAAAGFFFWARGRGLWKRQLFKLYVMAYAVYRFFTEFIRPERRFFGEWTAYQGACLLLLALFAWLWARDAQASEAGAAADESAADLTPA